MSGGRSGDAAISIPAAFGHCPACGRERDHGARGSNPLTCACGFTYYFNPAAAAGALLTDGEGQLLFIRRSREPGQGKLGIPGGFIDFGETGEEAVRREIEEEIGLKIGDVSYVTSFPNTYAYGELVYRVIDFFYHAEVACFDGIELDRDEVREWFLATPDSVSAEDFAFDSNWRAVAHFAALQGR